LLHHRVYGPSPVHLAAAREPYPSSKAIALGRNANETHRAALAAIASAGPASRKNAPQLFILVILPSLWAA